MMLDVKQETLIVFSHKYVKSSHFSWPLDANGFIDSTLVVEANIPLRRNAPGYDQAKVDELVAAAVEFAKAEQARLEFWSTS
jgi:hypothetical protein